MAEAAVLKGRKVSADERAALAELARNGIAKRTQTFEERCRRAITNEANCSRISAGERLMSSLLRERGIETTPQVAVGPYNVDLATDTVAVEILGGSWHLDKPGHPERIRYLLNAGWHLVFVWVDVRRFPLGEAAADYVVAFVNEVRGCPPSISQYRVIRGDGREVTRGGADRDDFTDVLSRRGCKRYRTSR
jgi:very-short-patch-repair endonuclease